MYAYEVIILEDDDLRVLIDPDRGADILSVQHRTSDVDVLFSTPWREHADEIRAGLAAPTSYDSVAGFVERYRGGWNTLCPNGGAPRDIHGAPVGFHGEAAAARWEVLEHRNSELRMGVKLFSVPLSIERHVTLAGAGRIIVDDTVHNDSDVELEIDYISHPAFGGAFLDGVCTVETSASRYTADPGTDGSFVTPGSEHAWPWAIDENGGRIDLREVPPPGISRMAFGWLSGFDEPWAAITNHDLGLTVRVAWDGTHQPYAWFWQELNWMPGFPWYRRARAFAIEPSTTVTSGSSRRSVLVVQPRDSVRIPLSLTVGRTGGESADGH